MSLALLGLLGPIAGAMMRPGAFGRPEDALSQMAPRGLLESMTPEEQATRGRQVQRQIRNPFANVGNIQAGLLSEHEGLLQMQEAERQQGLVEDVISSFGDLLPPYMRAAIRQDPSIIPDVVKGFTLSPGQAQTTVYGRTMAERLPADVLSEQERIRLAREDPNYLADLYALEEAKRGSETVAAGTALVNRMTGELVFSQPTTGMQNLDAGVLSEAEKDIDRKIRDIMNDPGHFGGYPRAVRLARGQEKIEIVPTLGIARRIDDIAGTVDEVPIGSLSAYEREVARVIPDGESSSPQDLSATATGAAPRAPDGLYQAAELGTGPAAIARRFGSQYISPLDPTGTLPIAGQTIAAQQRLQISNRDLQRAFASNPRYPVAEMERIREATNVEGMFFDTPRALQIRLREIEDYLSGVLQNERRIVRDPNAGADRRRAAETAISDIEQYLGTFGPRPEWMREQQTSQQEEPIPDWVLPNDVEIWPRMTPEQRREYESLIQAMRGNRQ